MKNIQIAGRCTVICSWYDDSMADFRRLYREHHAVSYEAYSKSIGNRTFEVRQEKAQMYCYENSGVLIKQIDFRQQTSGRYWDLMK